MVLKRKSTEELLDDEDVAPSADPAAADGATDAVGNSGWADVMTRLLTAPAAKKRYVILSKAKKTPALSGQPDAEEEPAESDPGFEVDGAEAAAEAEKKAKREGKVRSRAVKRKDDVDKRKKHREWEVLGRLKPDIRDKDRERTLCKIATRGVVQLFNAVRKQQQEVESRLKEAGGSIRKTENALKGVSKQAFLERLRADGGGSPDSGEEEEPAPSAGDAGRATWSVLRDDYMPEAGLKDWDRDSEEAASDSGSAGESEDGA